MAAVVLFVVLIAIIGELYTERGSLLSTAIFVYAATSPVNGYFGGALYARMGGKVKRRRAGERGGVGSGLSEQFGDSGCV